MQSSYDRGFRGGRGRPMRGFLRGGGRTTTSRTKNKFQPGTVCFHWVEGRDGTNGWVPVSEDTYKQYIELIDTGKSTPGKDEKGNVHMVDRDNKGNIIHIITHLTNEGQPAKIERSMCVIHFPLHHTPQVANDQILGIEQLPDPKQLVTLESDDEDE